MTRPTKAEAHAMNRRILIHAMAGGEGGRKRPRCLLLILMVPHDIYGGFESVHKKAWCQRHTNAVQDEGVRQLAKTQATPSGRQLLHCRYPSGTG